MAIPVIKPENWLERQILKSSFKTSNRNPKFPRQFDAENVTI